MPEFDTNRRASLGRTALTAFIFSLLMCWPIWITGQAFVFFDTAGYLKVGSQILELLGSLLNPLSSQATTIGDYASDDGASSLRSFGYSTFAASAVAVGGAFGLALAQGWIAIFMVLTLIPRPVVALPGLILALPMALTTLPWFTVLAMPDIFTAVIIAYGAVLWRAFDGLSGSHKFVLVLLAAGAGLAHYGNPPLGAGLYAFVLVGRFWQGRLTRDIVFAAILPVLMGPFANFGASAAVLDRPSTAPKHLPILLARSIEDGPAAWYLAEACPGGATLAICSAFDGQVPTDMTTFLWSDAGIKSLTNAELEAVRQEEGRILKAAFLAYPLAQTRSLTRNAWTQLWSVGLAKITATSALGSDVQSKDHSSDSLIASFDRIVEWATLIGALVLIIPIWTKPARFAPVSLILIGLILNAMVFGGLSAPDDRYQARVVWLLPAVAFSYLLEDLLQKWRFRSFPQAQKALGRRDTDGSIGKSV